jgi:hypothetical protein
LNLIFVFQMVSMDKKYFFLVYVSSAIYIFTQEELLILLDQCVELNKNNGITGMLLYKDGNFMQVLEGVKRMLSVPIKKY